MIVLSFVLVIVAAVTLIIGLFQDTLFWIWWSIGSCVVAMIFLGIGVLQRRSARPAQAEADSGYGPGAISGLLREEDEEERAADVTADEDVSVVPKRTVADAREQIGVPEDTGVDEEIVPSLGATAPPTAREAETEPAAPRAPADRQTTGAEARRQLEQVKGLGSAKLDALLARFGSLEAIQTASVEDLQQVKGFGAATAAQVHQQVAQLDGKAAARPAKKARKKAAKKTTKKTTGKAARERLGSVKGLGPAKQKALLDRFGSLESIRDADVEQLQEVKGIGEATAREIKRELS